jgi:hypothetical protein
VGAFAFHPSDILNYCGTPFNGRFFPGCTRYNQKIRYRYRGFRRVIAAWHLVSPHPIVDNSEYRGTPFDSGVGHQYLNLCGLWARFLFRSVSNCNKRWYRIMSPANAGRMQTLESACPCCDCVELGWTIALAARNEEDVPTTTRQFFP